MTDGIACRAASVGEEDATPLTRLICSKAWTSDALHERKMVSCKADKVRGAAVEALFGHPRAAARRAYQPPGFGLHSLAAGISSYNDGVVIVIVRPAFFEPGVCTHIAISLTIRPSSLIPALNDDMVVAETQIRSQYRIAKCAAGRKLSRVFLPVLVPAECKLPRKESMESRGRTSSVLTWNFCSKKWPSGKHILEIERVTKSYDASSSCASIVCGE